jgi:hypothetical protein
MAGKDKPTLNAGPSKAVDVVDPKGKGKAVDKSETGKET